MSSSSIPTTDVESGQHTFTATQYARFLRSCAVLNQRVPGLLFNRAAQSLLDSVAAGLSFFIAFQLRFDGVVPLRYRPLMFTWLLSMLLLRPISIWLSGAYSIIWRYFNLRDLFQLSLS